MYQALLKQQLEEEPCEKRQRAFLWFIFLLMKTVYVSEIAMPFQWSTRQSVQPHSHPCIEISQQKQQLWNVNNDAELRSAAAWISLL